MLCVDRYLLYNWPMTSAVVGISVNMFFLTIVGLLSWSHFFMSSKERTEPFKIKIKRPTGKSLSQSMEETQEMSESKNGTGM